MTGADAAHAGDPDAGADAVTAGFDRRLLAPLILGAILNPINSSIIASALVPIGVAFGAPAPRTAWLVSALYLATAIGQPLVGRLVDTCPGRRPGRRRPAVRRPTGLVSLALQNTLYHQAGPQRIGASAGLLRTFFYLGAIIASAATGIFFGPHVDAGRLRGLAVFMLAAAAVFVVATVADRSLHREDQLARNGRP